MRRRVSTALEVAQKAQRLHRNRFNAALVAAAPDLLAALIDAVSQMQANMPPAKYRKNDHAALWRHATFIRDLENARRAIAKATTEK